MINVADFGADPDALDNADAFRAAIRAALRRNSRLMVPGTAEGRPYKFATPDALELTGLGRGLHMQGDGLAELRLTAPRGSLLRMRSSNWVRLEHIFCTYDHADYDGHLVEAEAVGGRDCMYLRIHNCSFWGVGGAASFIRWNGVISSSIRDVNMIGARCGIVLGDLNHANVITLDNVAFGALSEKSIRYGSCQALNLRGCTFENATDGRSCGVEKLPVGFVWGLDYSGNWHGDVHADGGSAWLELSGFGINVSGNFFDQASKDARTPCVHILQQGSGSQGVAFIGNSMRGNPMKVDGVVRGGALIGNDMPTPMDEESYRNLMGFQYPRATMLSNFGQINQVIPREKKEEHP